MSSHFVNLVDVQAGLIVLVNQRQCRRVTAINFRESVVTCLDDYGREVTQYGDIAIYLDMSRCSLVPAPAVIDAEFREVASGENDGREGTEAPPSLYLADGEEEVPVLGASVPL